uniref:Uncharacterized protein n=1 Tax=Coturnix japonica TaxID=93934 RepID=A0A8C2SQ21_COTJA
MYLAEDHGLANGDAAIKVAEGLILLFPVPADKIVLPNVDNLQGKLPESFLEGGREKQHLAAYFHDSPLDADALGGESLRVNHDVSLVQHKHADPPHVEQSSLEAPVQHGAWCADDNLLLQVGLTSIALHSIGDLDVIAEPPHLLSHMANLQGQLTGGSQTKALGGGERY